MDNNIQHSHKQLGVAFELVTKYRDLPNAEAFQAARSQIPGLLMTKPAITEESEEFTFSGATIAGCREAIADCREVAGRVFGWFSRSTSEATRVLTQEEIRQQVGSLVQQERTIVSQRDAISQEITGIMKEMGEKFDEDFDRYFPIAVQLLKEKQLAFLQLQVGLLENLKRQEKLVRLYDPKITLVPAEWDAQIETLAHLINGLRGEVDQLKSQEPSTIGWLQEMASQFKAQCIASVCTEIENYLETLLNASESFTTVAQKQQAFQALLQEIEQDGLTDERLLCLQRSVSELDALKSTFETETEGLQQSIIDRLKSLYRSHPTIAKMVVSTMATVIGTAAAGPAGGFACRTAVERLMEHFEPSDNVETRSERIGSAIFQTVASLLAGGKTAAAVAGGSAVLREAAPEEVQKVVEASAFAVVAGKLGLSIPTSLGAGIGATLLCRNFKIIEKIKKDLLAAKTAVTNAPIQTPLKFLKWSVVETASFAKSVQGAVTGGKKCELITKLAVIAFSALAIHWTLWTLPLSLSLVYLSNRIFELKYEGAASLNNQHFRSFVVQEVSGASIKGRVERLKQLLVEENNDFQTFVGKLDRLMTPPQSEPLAEI